MVINLQRVITIAVLAATQNDEGGNEVVAVDAWTRRADVKDKTGSNQFTYDQQLWTNRRAIWVRHERTRPIKSNYMIQYGNQWLKIESISQRNESAKMYDVIECSNVDYNVTIPAFIMNPNMHREPFVLPANQTSVTVSEVASVTLENIMAVTLDGYDYPVIIAAGTPIEDQVKVVAGVVTFPYADDTYARNGYIQYQVTQL